MKSTFHRISRGVQNYLGKTTVESSLAWQKGHTSTRLTDVQRRIVIYLHALWGRDFVIKPIDEDFIHDGKYQPFVENNVIHLPCFYFDLTLNDGSQVTGLETYRAASVHAAAHLVYTKNPFPEKSLSKWQKALISAIEDARVETLLIREFPRLKQFWCTQHIATPLNDQSAGDYLNRLARALLDETYRDDDPWISQGRALFNAVDNLETNDISMKIGLTLAHAFQTRKIRFNARTDRLTAPYRDDNRYLWALATPDSSQPQELPDSFFESKLLLGNNEFASADDDTKQLSEDKLLRRTTVSETYSYSEWDYRSQVETPSWVTIREKKRKPGDLETIAHIVAQNNDLVVRMKNLLHAIRFSGVRRIRKLEEGDEIDINAAIRALIDIRLGVQPDTRIMMRQVRKTRDITVLVLLDLSNSTNQKIAGQGHTVLQLTQQICVLFAEVIESVGDPFAIHGFCSKSRHNVEYFRFKDFDQPYDDIPKGKIAGMTGQNSTRMGAAIRHATHYLNEQASDKKLLMLITDGAPSDIDVRGTKYLTYDAKMAVQEAGRCGIHTHCVSLDAKADEYVSRIFGARNYMVVDHIRCLPEKMLMIYAGLTR
jgi:nitric oxide reductase NorD protein